MELRSLIWKLLLEQVDQNTLNLKNKYVGEGKPISEDDFNKIIESSGNKFYLLSWLTKKVGQNIIKAEDVYKYKEYFDLYEKNKRKFTHKDIHLYKTAEDLKLFLDEVFKVREGNIVFDEIIGQSNFIPQNEIEKLERTGGAKYLGMYDNGDYKYQVFQIFGVDKDTWKTYRDILGRCKGRERGAKIDICTIAKYSYFKDYLTHPKGSSYFLLFNLDDPRSPYQLHFESGQFMDKNDREYHDIKQLKFFNFVGSKVPRYDIKQENFPGQFEIPVDGKGSEDAKGRKQGVWKHYHSNGKLSNVTTYVNGKENGPFETYHYNGNLDAKGTHASGERYVGEFEDYFESGKLHKKGTYDKDGKMIGVWFMNDYGEQQNIIDFSKSPHRVSGLTKDGRVRYIANAKYDGSVKPYGKIVFLYPSGKIAATGTQGATMKTGEWTYYDYSGKIKSKGKYRGGRRNGQWFDILKTKDGQTLKFVADFYYGRPSDKISVFDLNDNLIKKIKPKKVDPYWEQRISYRKFGSE